MSAAWLRNTSRIYEAHARARAIDVWEQIIKTDPYTNTIGY